MSYTVIDFETTGLDHVHDSIIQIGAVKLNHKAETIGVFEINVRIPAGKTLPEFITNLTGITPEVNQGGIVAPTAFTMFRAFIGQDTLIAHNAPFDLAFLQQHIRPVHRVEFYDTRSIIKLHEPGQAASLVDVCERRGISLEGHHTALSDAKATAELFRQLRDEIGQSKMFDEYKNVAVQSEERPLLFIPENARVIQYDTL